MNRLRFSIPSRRTVARLACGVAQLLLLVWFVVLARPGAAQAQGLEWGVKAGVIYSSVPGFFGKYYGPEGIANKGPSESGRKDLTVGGFLSVPLATRLAVQGEVSLARKGQAVTVGSRSPTVTRIRIDYVDASIFAKVPLNSNPRKRLYVLGGPILGVRVGEDATQAGVSVRAHEAQSYRECCRYSDARADIWAREYMMTVFPLASPDLLRRVVPSLGIGAGLELGLVVADVRFSNGLTSVLRNSEGIAKAFRAVAAQDELLALGLNEAAFRELLAWDPIYSGAKLRAVTVLLGVRF
jgi:hypothetical protein